MTGLIYVLILSMSGSNCYMTHTPCLKTVNSVFASMYFFCPPSISITLLGEERELVFVCIVHLFVCYGHVNLCHFFSSSWCRGLSAASACGSSWTFLFIFF